MDLRKKVRTIVMTDLFPWLFSCDFILNHQCSLAQYHLCFKVVFFCITLFFSVLVTGPSSFPFRPMVGYNIVLTNSGLMYNSCGSDSPYLYLVNKTLMLKKKAL